MKERPLYEFRLRDFVPLNGVIDYIVREEEALGPDGLDSRFDRRAFILIVYNSLALIGGINSVLSGLEKLIN